MNDIVYFKSEATIKGVTDFIRAKLKSYRAFQRLGKVEAAQSKLREARIALRNMSQLFGNDETARMLINLKTEYDSTVRFIRE